MEHRTKALVLLILAFEGSAVKFFCQNGTSIPAASFCNGVQDCDAASDETRGNSLCPLCELPVVSCTLPPRNLTCQIHRDYICNSTVSCLGLNPCDVGCPTHYKCSKTQKCAARSTLCDGNPCNGCPEDDDDWMSGIGFQCVRNGRFCLLPQQLLWDSVQDCADGSDLCYKSNFPNDARDLRNLSGTVFDDEKCFKCLDGSMIVPRRKVCDGTIDCSDLSDECLCERQMPSICDHVQLRPVSQTKSCAAGQVSCTSPGNTTTCVNTTSICDGISDCYNNFDEKFAYCKGTLKCADGKPDDAETQCRCQKGRCREVSNYEGWPTSTTAILCNGIAECPLFPGASWFKPPGYPQEECVATCPNATRFPCTNSFQTAVLINPPFISLCRDYLQINATFKVAVTKQYTNNEYCDGVLYCPYDRQDEKNCRDRFECNSGNLISILKTKVCDGVRDCDHGEDEVEENCTKRFYCSSLNGKQVSIPVESKCNLISDCDDSSDELNCTDGRFYCENKRPLFVSRQQILDGRGDCSDWSDECSQQIQTAVTILSSRYELIANTFLRAIVWIMAVLALLGNGIVIFGEVKQVKRILKRGGSASLRTNHMLVLNLAVADLLMGIYLLTLGIAGAVYSGTYCSRTLEWLTSKTCVAMGVLVVLSSQTSVFTMILLTVSRLYAVYNPVPSMSRPRNRYVVICIVVVWCISLVFALVPLSSYQNSAFTEKVLITNNPLFGNVVVDFAAAKNLTRKLVTFSSDFSHLPNSVFEQIQAMTSWSQLQNFMAEHSPNSNFLTIKSYFGYYSASSVCIPNLFVTMDNGAWQFSLAISIVNFLSFLFVATGYGVIIWKARKTVSQSQNTDKKSSNIQRKIIRLIATDFCCWIPLSMMVFVNFSGVAINNISYAVAAILLLPINSALNPILYSNIIDSVFEKCKKKDASSTGRVVSTQGTATEKSSSSKGNTQL